MSPAVDFGQVLDEKLGLPGQPRSAPQTAWERGAGAASWSPACLPLMAAARAACRRVYGPVAASSAAPAPPLRESPRQPRRRSLSPRQRAALSAMQRLGAPELDSECTEEQVKRAFRNLALRYHPDRHATCPAEDRQRLGRLFAEVAQAYRTLLVDERQVVA